MRALPPKIVRAFWESPWNSLFLDRQGGKAIAGTSDEDSQDRGNLEIVFSSTSWEEKSFRGLGFLTLIPSGPWISDPNHFGALDF